MHRIENQVSRKQLYTVSNKLISKLGFHRDEYLYGSEIKRQSFELKAR